MTLLADLHLPADAVAAFCLWLLTTGISELVVKPLWRRLYQRADAAAGDRLPNLH